MSDVSRQTEVWMIRVLSFARGLLPPTNLYRRRLEEIYEESRRDLLSWLAKVDAIPILIALREDIEKGHLTPVDSLVSSELAGGFLDQAALLADSGYALPAASLAGAVLEEGLRRIAAKHDVNWTGRSSIATLAKVLQVAEVLDDVQARKIALWNVLRNKADHMERKGFRGGDVTPMIQGVREFLEQFLS